MKFAIIASLFAAANALKIMTEEQIREMSFEEQNALIDQVQAESSSLRAKINDLQVQNAADNQRIQDALNACAARTGELEAELAAEEEETVTLIADNEEAFDLHVQQEDARLQAVVDDYAARISGLEADLVVAQQAAADALAAHQAAQARLNAANDAAEAEASRHQTEMESIEAAGQAEIAPINQRTSELSAEVERLQGISDNNVNVVIPDLEAQVANLEASLADLEAQLAGLRARIQEMEDEHNGIMSDLAAELAAVIDAHEAWRAQWEIDFAQLQVDLENNYNTETARVDGEREASYEADLAAAIAEATKMDENTIYEVCTKIDQQGDGDIPVVIQQVDAE